VSIPADSGQETRDTAHPHILNPGFSGTVSVLTGPRFTRFLVFEMNCGLRSTGSVLSNPGFG
jgi:hypothetical protein